MIDQQDQDLYDEVGAAFADVRLDRGPDDVIRRGRTLRRRRRAMPALAAAGVLAFSLSLAAVTVHSHSSSRAALVNVDEAAFSVHTDASSGVVTITIREFFDENEFKQILARAGITAVFHDENVIVTKADGGELVSGMCDWVGAKRVTTAGEMTYGTENGVMALRITPSRMPHGSVLAFVYDTPNIGPRFIGPELLSNTPTGCVVR
ncbi:MAG TPA: hypothetical protein VFN97_15300 [Actinospica sp.]|nr:hypothetical protein [Actinospica sp.]